MSKAQGPKGLVPFSSAIQRTLAFLVIIGVATGVYEYISLETPAAAAPISWAFWWLKESTGAWFPVTLAATAGAFFSHFFWYKRTGDFWFPITRGAAIIIAIGTWGTLAATGIYLNAPETWALFAFLVLFQVSAVLAHRFWYRLERFDEHLARFHEEEK